MDTIFHHRLSLVIFFILSIYSCTSKYAEDSEDEVERTTDSNPGDDPSSDSEEDLLSDQGVEDDAEGEDNLPDGFEVLDGVIVDITNLMVQEVTDTATVYKMYNPEGDGRDHGVKYTRPKREAGWHFIMFEDPLEKSGLGHLILLQKMLGFTIEKGNNSASKSKELRLYEVFHVDLNNDVTEESDNDIDDKDNEGNSAETVGADDKQDMINGGPEPNDSAEIVPSLTELKGGGGKEGDGDAGGGDEEDGESATESEGGEGEGGGEGGGGEGGGGDS